MIRIRLTHDDEGRWLGFDASGHARTAPHGHDIVCAAVSALLQSTLLGLTEVVGADVSASKRSGRLTCLLSDASAGAEGPRVLLETLRLSLRQIVAQYPTFVSVEEKRRQSRNGGRAVRASKKRGPGARAV